MALDLNRDNYDAEVLESKEPVMVDFWGPQCRPCLALMPAVEQLEKEYTGKLKVTKVNATGNLDWRYDGGLLFIKFDF